MVHHILTGNIRLEDGKPSDVWYTSCEDLLLSRFYNSDFRAYNVGDLRVHRVTRIHNRFLRNRFDAAMEKVARKRSIRVASADATGKRNLEYLFFGEDPRLNRISGAGNELLRIPGECEVVLVILFLFLFFHLHCSCRMYSSSL